MSTGKVDKHTYCHSCFHYFVSQPDLAYKEKITCEGCALSCHRFCYQPTTQNMGFVCDVCANQLKEPPACIICKNTDGLLKKVDHTNYGHMICLLSTNQFIVKSYQNLDFVPFDPRDQRQQKNKCSSCDKKTFYTYKCNRKKCRKYIHLYCLLKDQNLYANQWKHNIGLVNQYQEIIPHIFNRFRKYLERKINIFPKKLLNNPQEINTKLQIKLTCSNHFQEFNSLCYCGKDYVGLMDWVECDYCRLWMHMKCEKIPKQYFSEHETFKCSQCHNWKNSLKVQKKFRTLSTYPCLYLYDFIYIHKNLQKYGYSLSKEKLKLLKRLPIYPSLRFCSYFIENDIYPLVKQKYPLHQINDMLQKGVQKMKNIVNVLLMKDFVIEENNLETIKLKFVKKYICLNEFSIYVDNPSSEQISKFSRNSSKQSEVLEIYEQVLQKQISMHAYTEAANNMPIESEKSQSQMQQETKQIEQIEEVDVSVNKKQESEQDGESVVLINSLMQQRDIEQEKSLKNKYQMACMSIGKEKLKKKQQFMRYFANCKRHNKIKYWKHKKSLQQLSFVTYLSDDKVKNEWKQQILNRFINANIRSNDSEIVKKLQRIQSIKPLYQGIRQFKQRNELLIYDCKQNDQEKDNASDVITYINNLCHHIDYNNKAPILRLIDKIRKIPKIDEYPQLKKTIKRLCNSLLKYEALIQSQQQFQIFEYMYYTYSINCDWLFTVLNKNYEIQERMQHIQLKNIGCHQERSRSVLTQCIKECNIKNITFKLQELNKYTIWYQIYDQCVSQLPPKFLTPFNSCYHPNCNQRINQKRTLDNEKKVSYIWVKKIVSKMKKYEFPCCQIRKIVQQVQKVGDEQIQAYMNFMRVVQDNLHNQGSKSARIYSKQEIIGIIHQLNNGQCQFLQQEDTLVQILVMLVEIEKKIKYASEQGNTQLKDKYIKSISHLPIDISTIINNCLE